MIFGLFLGLAMVYLYSLKDKMKSLFIYLLMIFVVGCIFLCGIRTPIGAIFVTVLFYLLMSRQIKLMIYAIIWDLYAILLSKYSRVISNIDSIFTRGNRQTNVEGSSFEMRFEQFNGCLREIRDCIVFGKGYGWSSYYISIHELHSCVISFESLVFVVLCNNGIVGCLFGDYIIWLLGCL